MRRLLIHRLAISVPLVLFVTFLTFGLQSITPGDTARTILGQNFTPAAYAELRSRLGLNEPLLVQYWNWLRGALMGNLGRSPISGLDVGSEIMNRLEVTLSLLLVTVVVAGLVGLALGTWSAVRGGGFIAGLIDVLSLAGFAVPSYWLGLILVTVFAVMMPLLPATGFVPFSSSPGGWAAAIALPVATLVLGSVAVIASQTRAAMKEALSAEYVLALRANGASEASIILRHGLRNAAIPVTTVLGLVFVNLLSGTVLVEAVFAMPGLGGLAIDATQQHDVPMIQGVALTFILIVVVVNLLIDLSYGWLNPKVRVA